MPPRECPTCGSSILSPSAGAAVPAICPACCALLHEIDGDGAGARAVPLARARQPKPVLRMPLGRDPGAPAAARHALEELRQSLDDERFHACKLLTTELVTNVLRHAPARSAWSTADMRVRMYPDRVRIEVRDDGIGFKPRPRRPDQDVESGWGLHLVEELSDDWGVEPGVQNCVWFSLSLAQEESRAAQPSAS
jgi:anti-sigma regulatory factor (Ser/Thr protein kinase)